MGGPPSTTAPACADADVGRLMAWPELLEHLADCAKRYQRETHPAVHDFIELTGRCYRDEVADQINNGLRDAVVGAVLAPVQASLRSYIQWLNWTAWNVSAIAPVLHRDLGGAAERLALATLAHSSLRLVDDAFDGHETYKGRHRSFFGELRATRPDVAEHAAAGLSAFLGLWLFDRSLDALERKGHERAAAAVRTLFEQIVPGVVAELMWTGGVSAPAYERIVSRKSVAYNMMLYKPFLVGVEPALARHLLSVLADMDLIAQLLNDLNDVAEDAASGQPNAVLHEVYGDVSGEIRSRTAALVATVGTLPPRLNDALCAMFLNLGLASATTDGPP